MFCRAVVTKRQLVRKLRRVPSGARTDLLRVLTSPSNTRADVIRQFYERPAGQEMAEVLIELEKDELIRAQVIELLRWLEHH
jgi:hypothetical protein